MMKFDSMYFIFFLAAMKDAFHSAGYDLINVNVCFI